MSLIFNGTSIESVKFNGTSLDKVIYNGVEVFSAKLGVLLNTSFTGGYTWSWKNTTGRSVTLTVTVFSYAEFTDEGYCYTYWDATSTGGINNQATYGALDETKTTKVTIPNGYYFAMYAEHYVTRGTAYVAEE